MADRDPTGPLTPPGKATRSAVRRLQERIARNERATIDAGYAGEGRMDAGGPTIIVPTDDPGAWVKITAASGFVSPSVRPSYSFVELQGGINSVPQGALVEQPGGVVADYTGLTAPPAYEVNDAATVPIGAVVRAYFYGGQAACWEFSFTAVGSDSPCPPLTVGSVTYGGVNLLVDSTALQAIDAVLSLDALYDFARSDWPGRLSPLGAEWLTRQEVPRLNVVYWPTVGVSRCAVGYFLTDAAGLATIRPAAYSGGTLTALPFVMDDGAGGTLTLDLFMLPPRPLGADGDNQYLLTLVDSRYFKWEAAVNVGVTPGTTTWASLLSTLGFSTADSVPAAYLKPPADFNKAYEFLPPQMDAAARSVGMKAVAALDGTIKVTSPTTAHTAFAADLTAYPVPSASAAAGGLIDLTTDADSDLAGVLPVSVTAAFPDITSGVTPLWGSFPVVTSLVSTGLFAGAATYNATRLLRSTCVVGPTNSAEYNALAARMALDWYSWQDARPDVAYTGIVPWTPSGLEDRVEWAYHCGTFSTRVQRPAWNARDTGPWLHYGSFGSVSADPKTLIAKTTSAVAAISGDAPGAGTATVYVMVAGTLVSTTDTITVYNDQPHAVPSGARVKLVMEPVSQDWFVVGDDCGLTVNGIANVGSIAFVGGPPVSDLGSGPCGEGVLVEVGPSLVVVNVVDITTYLSTISYTTYVLNKYDSTLYLIFNGLLVWCGVSSCGSGSGSGSSGSAAAGGQTLGCCPGLVLPNVLHLFITGCSCVAGSVPLTYYAAGHPSSYSGLAGWASAVFTCGGKALQFGLLQSLGAPCVLHASCDGTDTTAGTSDSCTPPISMNFVFDAALLVPCCGALTKVCYLTE